MKSLELAFTSPGVSLLSMTSKPSTSFNRQRFGYVPVFKVRDVAGDPVLFSVVYSEKRSVRKGKLDLFRSAS